MHSPRRGRPRVSSIAARPVTRDLAQRLRRDLSASAGVDLTTGQVVHAALLALAEVERPDSLVTRAVAETAASPEEG